MGPYKDIVPLKGSTRGPFEVVIRGPRKGSIGCRGFGFRGSWGFIGCRAHRLIGFRVYWRFWRIFRSYRARV